MSESVSVFKTYICIYNCHYLPVTDGVEEEVFIHGSRALPDLLERDLDLHLQGHDTRREEPTGVLLIPACKLGAQALVADGVPKKINACAITVICHGAGGVAFLSIDGIGIAETCGVERAASVCIAAVGKGMDTGE